jgi:hypothetical protein
MCEDQVCIVFDSSPAARQNQTSTKDKPQKEMGHEVAFNQAIGVRRPVAAFDLSTAVTN